MTKKCLHCSLPAPKNEDFCCAGCKAAYGTIHQLGFGSYYQNRILSDQEINLKPAENPEFTQSDIQNFVHKNDDGSFSAYFLIKGLHCGACIWLIESVLKKQENIKIARVNMSNKRLHLSWFGEKKYGNQLAEIINNLGYQLCVYDYEELKSEEDKYNNDLLKAMCVAGFGSGNIMLMSIPLWTTNPTVMGMATHSFLGLISAILAVPVILYSGRIFFKSALKSIKSGFGNMDIAISVAIIITTIVSIIEVIDRAPHIYFDSAVMLIFFLLIGRYLDFNTRRKALSIARDFSLLGAITATIFDKNGKNKIILAKNIKKNMILNIAVGDKIAADGLIIEGETELDTSLITGESLPQKFSKNAQVFAGMINIGAPIKVLVTQSQKNSLMAKIGNLVQNLELSKSRFVRIADKISQFYTPTVHLLAFSTFGFWYILMEAPFKVALLNAVAVLIITCPCALALAVPIVSVLANSRLLKKGIIVKSGEALEKLSKIDTIVFDKTGTLTLGKPVLESAIFFKNGVEKELKSNHELFQSAISLAGFSSHPLSKALRNSVELIENIHLENTKIQEISGNGLKTVFNKKELKLGKKEFVLTEDEQKLIKPSQNPQVFVKLGEEIAIFTFSDVLKSDAKKVISQLKNSGKKIILLSGDKKEVVETIAAQLKIDHFYYNKTPIEKVEIIQELKGKSVEQNGKKSGGILMVGDGINDAPPLIASDVAISMSNASDITKNCADIIFQGEKLEPLLEILETQKRFNRLIKQNFILSFSYNIIAIPFAFLGYVTPFVAAAAMSFSSISVTLNSLRIRKNKI